MRTVLYVLLGTLAGIAALAGVALLLAPANQPAGTSATAVPTAASVPAASMPAAPVLAAPVPAAPSQAAAVSSPPTPDTQAAAPAGTQMQALQEQIREATTALADLRSEAEQLRAGLAKPPAVAARPEGAPTTPPPGVSQQGWRDAERTVAGLQQPRLAPAAPAPKGATAPAAVASVPAAVPDAAALDAIVELPHPRVFLFYRGGSQRGLSAVAGLARRLVDSDFDYADTRSSNSVPTHPVIRYYYPQDAQAAQRLKDLFAPSGITFRVQDLTGQPTHATQGTLDVWVGG